jgi:hypothetical protein
MVSFAIAMALVAAAIVMNLLTWYVARRTEKATRVLKLERIGAAARGEAVLEDVEIEGGEKRGLTRDVMV